MAQKTIRHKIAHLLRMNKGKSDAFYQGDKLMMSFLCSTCGKREGIHHIDDAIDDLISNRAL